MGLINRSWTLSIVLGVLLILNVFAAHSLARSVNEAKVGEAEVVHPAASGEETKKVAQSAHETLSGAAIEVTKPGSVQHAALEASEEVVENSVDVESRRRGRNEHGGHRGRGNNHRGKRGRGNKHRGNRGGRRGRGGGRRGRGGGGGGGGGGHH